MLIPISLALIILIICYIIIPFFVFQFARNSKIGKIITIVSLVTFCVVLFFGITSKLTFIEEKVLIELDYSSDWCSKTINFSLTNIMSTDFIINITMLIPIGLSLFYLMKCSNWKKFDIIFVIGLVTGILLETIQFILPVPRSVELSDVLLNTISTVFGGGIGIMFDTMFRKKEKSE